MVKKRFRKIAVFMVAALSFIICGFLYSCSADGDGSTVRTEKQGVEDTLPESVADISSSVSSSEFTSEASFVYVCGSVMFPGVYEVSADSRVFEVIDMAGGVNEEGCLEALNLADHIYDGQKIYVPTYEEYSKSASEWDAGSRASSDGRGTLVNINTADETLLMTLPGIGASKAGAIVEYRKKHGSFDSIEDIMNVAGIKQSAFDKIKDMICTK